MNIRKKLAAGALALGVLGGSGLAIAPAASARPVIDNPGTKPTMVSYRSATLAGCNAYERKFLAQARAFGWSYKRLEKCHAYNGGYNGAIYYR